jgi:hypothetical protein
MIKKAYVPPLVSKFKTNRKIEIDSDIVRMMTKQGFKDLFDETFKEAKKQDQKITQEQIFNLLNEKWTAIIGEPRYSSYDAFRRRKDS